MNIENNLIKIGEKLKRLRLNADLSQEELANKIGVGRKAIQSAEQGKTKLAIFIAMLLELGQFDIVEALETKPAISPVQLAKLESEVRQRASGNHKKTKDTQNNNNQGKLGW